MLAPGDEYDELCDAEYDSPVEGTLETSEVYGLPAMFACVFLTLLRCPRKNYSKINSTLLLHYGLGELFASHNM
jgi:hypothetical protein